MFIEIVFMRYQGTAIALDLSITRAGYKKSRGCNKSQSPANFTIQPKLYRNTVWR